MANLVDAEAPPDVSPETAEFEKAFLAVEMPEPVIDYVVSDTSYAAEDPDPNRLDLLEPDRRKRCEDAIAEEGRTILEKSADEVLLQDVPKGTKIHRSLLLLKEKKGENPDGTMFEDRTKARCCFFGAQNAFDAASVESVFAPCVKWMSVLICACLIAMFAFHFSGIDYSAAYLNARLTTPVYVWPPKPLRRVERNGNILVWLVYGALYGHPEAGAAWFKLLISRFKAIDFKQHQTDPCVFSRWSGLHFCVTQPTPHG